MSKKEVTIAEFADELINRIKVGKTIDCCKDEIIHLVLLAKEKLGSEKILVDWQD